MSVSADPVTIWSARVRAYQRAGRDAKKLADARRNLAEAKLAREIEQTIHGEPPLTTEQRERLAALLLGTDLNARVADLLGDDQ